MGALIRLVVLMQASLFLSMANQRLQMDKTVISDFVKDAHEYRMISDGFTNFHDDNEVKAVRVKWDQVNFQ